MKAKTATKITDKYNKRVKKGKETYNEEKHIYDMIYLAALNGSYAILYQFDIDDYTYARLIDNGYIITTGNVNNKRLYQINW